MIASVTYNRVVDVLPSFDLGKVWRFFKVDAPVRSIPLKMRDKPIAWIAYSEHDNEGWAGMVYSSKDGQRLIYMPIEEGSREALLDEAKYLSIAPMEYIKTARRLKHSSKETFNFSAFASDIEDKLTEPVSEADRAWVIRCEQRDATPDIAANGPTLG